jgi:pimeloyl-ACP methyl ester carboxylesterase
MATTLSNTTEGIKHPSGTQDFDTNRVRYQTIKIAGQDIFYREAGTADKPTILLLHGFPTSSHMFRNLLIALGSKYHLVAPDYPGFGNSSMPSTKEFEYSFDNLADIISQFTEALNLKKFSLYIMDYGAPVGFRIATKHPEKVQAFLVQNGNAYMEGLSPFWDGMKAYWKEPKDEANINFIKSLLTLEGTKSQYLTGVRDATAISPDNWIVDQRGLDRPGNQEIQMELFYSYRTNPPLYADWQAYLRKYQPPTLITWGKNDNIFPATGAYPFKKDVKNAELHILDTGHFALEEDGAQIASLIDQFLQKNNIR